MKPKIKDVLNVSVVLVGIELLSTQDMAEKFKDDVQSEVIMNAGTFLGVQANASLAVGRSFSIEKHRIGIQCAKSQSVCRLEYPTEESLDRLAEVTYLSIENTFPQPHEITIPIGYNIELVYDLFSESERSAYQYIAKKIFSPLTGEGWGLIGGAGTFSFNEYYQENHDRWNVKIEPRFNQETTSTIFLSANLHFKNIALPKTKEEILNSLNRVWEQAPKIIERIDENVDN